MSLLVGVLLQYLTISKFGLQTTVSNVSRQMAALEIEKLLVRFQFFVASSSRKHETASACFLCFISPFQFPNLNILLSTLVASDNHEQNNDFNVYNSVWTKMNLKILSFTLSASFWAWTFRRTENHLDVLCFQVVTTQALRHLKFVKLENFFQIIFHLLSPQFGRSGSIPSYPKVLPCLLCFFHRHRVNLQVDLGLLGYPNPILSSKAVHDWNTQIMTVDSLSCLKLAAHISPK